MIITIKTLIEKNKSSLNIFFYPLLLFIFILKYTILYIYFKINNPYRLPSSMSEVGNTARPFG